MFSPSDLIRTKLHVFSERKRIMKHLFGPVNGNPGIKICEEEAIAYKEHLISLAVGSGFYLEDEHAR